MHRWCQQLQKLFTLKRLVMCSMVWPENNTMMVNWGTSHLQNHMKVITLQVMPQKSSVRMMARYLDLTLLVDRHLAGISLPSQVPNRYTMELRRKYFEKRIPLIHQNHDFEINMLGKCSILSWLKMNIR